MLNSKLVLGSQRIFLAILVGVSFFLAYNNTTASAASNPAIVEVSKAKNIDPVILELILGPQGLLTVQ